MHAEARNKQTQQKTDLIDLNTRLKKKKCLTQWNEFTTSGKIDK